MLNDIDWDNAEEVRNFGYDLAIQSGENQQYTDINIALSVLRHFDKDKEFTFNELWNDFRHIPNLTKERLTYILYQIAGEMHIVTRPSDKPKFKVHNIYHLPVTIEI